MGTTFRSASFKDADIYYWDFKNKFGHFFYSKKPHVLEAICATLCNAFSFSFYFVFSIAVTVFLALFHVDLIVFLVSVLICDLLVLGNVRARDAFPNLKGVEADRVLSAESLSNPTFLRVENWADIYWFYDGDVKKQLKEALLMKIPTSKDWLLSISFEAQPSNGTLGFRLI
jgi:hypothetical protein